MTKNIARWLAKLERKFAPEARMICVIDTPENRALVAKGCVPDDWQTTAPPVPSSIKREGKGRAARRRLGSGDIVVFLSELEMAL
jgi:hypothetical protein